MLKGISNIATFIFTFENQHLFWIWENQQCQYLFPIQDFHLFSLATHYKLSPWGADRPTNPQDFFTEKILNIVQNVQNAGCSKFINLYWTIEHGCTHCHHSCNLVWSCKPGRTKGGIIKMIDRPIADIVFKTCLIHTTWAKKCILSNHLDWVRSVTIRCKHFLSSLHLFVAPLNCKS